jgi:hypothetical protein
VPRVTPRPKIDKNAVYVAFTSFGLDESEFPGGVVKRGAEFPGQPCRRPAPPQLLHPYRHAAERVAERVPRSTGTEPARAHGRGARALPANQLMEAICPLRFGFGGANRIEKGERLPKTHRVVQDNPQFFKEVKEDGE